MQKFYDVVSIGSSPKIFMKVCEYAKENKSILILDSTSNLGGNWKTTSFANCENVEFGCFAIPNNKQDYEFIMNEMNIEMPITEYQPYTIYKNKFYPMNSVLLYALLDYRKNKTLKNAWNIVVSYFQEKVKAKRGDYITRYFKYGIKGLLDGYKAIIDKYNIEVCKDEKVKDIYVDFDNEVVDIVSENHKIQTKNLLIGAGIDIEKIRSSKYDFFINQNRGRLSLFTFVLVKVKVKKPLNFTYVDLTHLDNNNFSDNLLSKVDFYQETRTSYDKYKLVWRVTNVTDYATGDKDGYAILSIDTNSWLPKEEYSDDMLNEVMGILRSASLLEEDEQVVDAEWNTNEATTIGNLEKLVSEYYSPYVSSTNSLFFTRNPR